MAKISFFGNILKVFGNFLSVYLALGKTLNLLLKVFYAIHQVFMARN